MAGRPSQKETPIDPLEQISACFKEFSGEERHGSFHKDSQKNSADCFGKDNAYNIESFDIRKFDVTKRRPPPLFKDGKISDSARDTCKTIMEGFEMTASQNILCDGDICEESFDKTQNATDLLNEINIHKQIHTRMWYGGKQKEMFSRILELRDLLTAIEKKNRDEIMRIYYRSQHIHTLDDHTSPLNVQIHIENDRLNSEWLPHIHNAIEQISIAAPGIKFAHTLASFKECTNYIQIGVDEINAKDDTEFEKHMKKAYTSFKRGYPFIHLGNNRHPVTMKGTSIHELLHALGFGHQMMRFDSNLYLNVNTENLTAEQARQYKPCTISFTRFDPFSIMMYPEDDKIMTRVKEEKIWNLKKDPDRWQHLSEIDKVALNLMYKPCKSESTYSYLPVISETTNMLYCGRDVMQSHNQNVPPTLNSKCGPNIWANCTSCRVFKDFRNHEGNIVQIITIKECLKEGRWQGLSGNFYCGNIFEAEFVSFRFNKWINSDGVCGPDQGIPCSICGAKLKPGYSYTHFNPITQTLLDDCFL